MLDISASYHCMQFQGKLINQTPENDRKKLVLGLILAHYIYEVAASGAVTRTIVSAVYVIKKR